MATIARKVITNDVYTFAMHARVGVTIDDQDFTVSAVKVIGTLTRERVDLIHARAAILANDAVTVVDVGRAVGAGVSGEARARERGDAVNALPIGARRRRTVVDVNRTVQVRPALVTRALVVVDSVHALTMFTQVTFTIIKVNFAVCTVVASIALALVRVCAVDANTM